MEQDKELNAQKIRETIGTLSEQLDDHREKTSIIRHQIMKARNRLADLTASAYVVADGGPGEVHVFGVSSAAYRVEFDGRFRMRHNDNGRVHVGFNKKKNGLLVGLNLLLGQGGSLSCREGNETFTCHVRPYAKKEDAEVVAAKVRAYYAAHPHSRPNMLPA